MKRLEHHYSDPFLVTLEEGDVLPSNNPVTEEGQDVSNKLQTVAVGGELCVLEIV